jgi:hypothetical protein
LRELPVATYDNASAEAKRFVVLGIDVVKGDAREERAPIGSGMGKEEGLLPFLERVVGEKGVFEGARWKVEEGTSAYDRNDRLLILYLAEYFQSVEAGSDIEGAKESNDIEAAFKNVSEAPLKVCSELMTFYYRAFH